MGILLRYFAIALVVIIGAIILSVCAEGFCVSCSAAYRDGVIRSKSSGRFFRRLSSAYQACLHSARASVSYLPSHRHGIGILPLSTLPGVVSLRI